MHSHPTATLWLFAYGGITPPTHAAVCRELRQWTNLAHHVMGEEALICRARSRAASRFLKEEAQIGGDVLLMVDHDIAWAPGDLSLIARRALERNAVVGGIYPKRVFADGSAVRFNASGTGDWHIGEDSLIPASYVGSGFLAIPRDCLRTVADSLPWIEEGYWPFFLPMTVLTEQDGKKGHEYLSEDWAFCERARTSGFDIYASTGPRLTHEGRYTFRLVDARARPPKDEDITLTFSRPAVAGKE